MKIKSFNIKKNTRIGNYRVLDNIGRGWEGEVYKVSEVPTEAIRAMKIFRTYELDEIRQLAHTAYYFEALRVTGHFPIYHHYGQWFFDDDNGCWFLVFEFIDGKSLKHIAPTYSQSENELLFIKLAHAVASVHEQEYAVGDFANLDNVFLEGERIVFVDCDRGTPDNPNSNYGADCNEELVAAARKIFGKSKPSRVKHILSEFRSVKRFSKKTLSSILKRVDD